MSLFNTIAHDGAFRARGFSPRAGMITAGLVLAVAVGFVVVNRVTAEEPSGASAATGSAGVTDRFIRINTTDLEYPISQYVEESSGPR